MKKYIKLGVIFLSTMQVLCSCKSSPLNDNVQTQEIQVNQQDKLIKTPYIGYFQKKMDPSAYEPLQGAYLGAYVLGNPELAFDITRFERAVDRNMALALRYYQVGDPFPDKWLLQCLAEKKTPYMVINPNNMESPYDNEALRKTAEKFKNTYSIPVFIEFYPGAKAFGNPKDYIANFQRAKEIFLQEAPNTVFVWTMDMEEVYDSMLYYPGDDYVDWIGMNMYFPIYKNNEKYLVDINKTLDYFYNMYQSKKPLMISKLAVSHYSNKDHTFYVNEAADIINHIYSQIPVYYPRIKGINYIDMDNIHIAPDKIGHDNFRVSTEAKVTKIYKEAINNPYYLESVEEDEENSAYQWIKMLTSIYEKNEKLYILEDTIIYDWEIEPTNKIKQHKYIIAGREYYDFDQVIKSLNYRYTLEGNIIRIYKDKSIL